MKKALGLFERFYEFIVSKIFIFVLIPNLMIPLRVSSEGTEMQLDKAALQNFISKHCIDCHGPTKQKADVRLDLLDFSITDKNEALHYQDFLDALNSGEMPPEDEPQPSFDELEDAIGELTEGLFKARKALASRGGKVDMRRLNRREYAGTIRHLFGMEPANHQIPQDLDVENFDTVGVRQTFTTEHFDLYYELGRKVLKAGFKWAGVKEKLETKIQEPEKYWNSHFKSFIEKNKNQPKGTKSYRLTKMRYDYFELPYHNTGVYLSEPLRHLSYGHQIDPRGRYKMSIKAGLQGNVHPIRRFVTIHSNDEPAAVFGIDGTPTSPTYSEIFIQPKTIEGRINGRVSEDRTGAWHSHYINFLKRSEGIDSNGLIWIDYFKFEGPYYPEKRSFFDVLLCPQEPTPDKRSPIVRNDENAYSLIEKFTFEAFRRREASSDYLNGLHDFFKGLRREGLSFNDAMIDTLAIVMASPAFVYHQEHDIVQMGKRKLSEVDVATRLSYFLTGGPPDEELYRAAKATRLSNKKVFHEHIDRLLDTDKSNRFIEGFTSQWADFDRLESIVISSKTYPTYTAGLKHSMKREVVSYMDELIRKNMPVSNLIQSNFVIVNSKMAQHYGIPGVNSNDYVKVLLPQESPRGGFLSQGAFHVTGSTGTRTSPTIRGMLVLTRFFNSPPPPPPPNVPELGATADGPLTSRQLVELHQKQVQCSSCHKEMDSIGLALENFDQIGRWRDTEGFWRTPQPIDVEGSTKDGIPFNNYREFQFTMLKQEGNLARNMVESLIVYALGRDIEFTDRPHIDAILKKIKRNGYRMKDMIHAVVASPLFFKN